jgi:hypothetical protein
MALLLVADTDGVIAIATANIPASKVDNRRMPE